MFRRVNRSSLWVYPHSMSYFNELARGPKNGHWHLGGSLSDSNIDWGQDLLFLKKWQEEHPEARPFYLDFNGPFDPSIAGIDYERPSLPLADGDFPTKVDGGPSLPPGWYAISVNLLHSRDKRYAYFLKVEPVDRVGYTVHIYRVADTNQHRKDRP